MHILSALGIVPVLLASLTGLRAALILACGVLIFAFWRPALRDFGAITRGRTIIMSDKLAAGIWLTAVGVVISDVMRLGLTMGWDGHAFGLPISLMGMSFGIFLMVLGYMWHFQAWVSVAHPTAHRAFMGWSITITAVAIAGFIFAFRLS